MLMALRSLHPRCAERLTDGACARRELNFWDTATGERSDRTYSYASQAWADVAASPDGSLLAIVDEGQQIHLIDAQTLQPAGAPLPMPEDNSESVSITGLAFSPDGRWLGASGLTSFLLLWDVETHEWIGNRLVDPSAEELPISVFEPTWSVAFSPDSQRMATGGDEGDVRIWDVASVTQLQSLDREDFSVISALAFSPDGHTLAAGNWNQEIALWDLDTGRLVGQPLAGHSGSIVNMDFHPTGSLLASTGQDGNALLWDVATGQLLGPPLNPPEIFVYDVDFSPDGRWLALGSIDQLSLWDMTDTNWSELACQRAQLNFTLPEWEQAFPDRPYEPICPQSASGLADFADRTDIAAQGGDIDRARQLYNIATEWVVQTSDDRESRSICHFGYINGFAEEVFPACEHTVEYNPTYGPRYSDRGVARALTGDIVGAIADFEFYLQWLDDFRAANDIFFSDALYETMRGPRADWMSALQAGRNPFDAATLAGLREE